MTSYERTFDWMEFSQGCVRYVGGRRGREEPSIEVFAVAFHGRTNYGEIREAYLADGNRYNLEVVSFGWLDDEWFGTEPYSPSCLSFSSRELEEVQLLLCSAVVAWRDLEDGPCFLYESEQSRFMGDVIFRDGWALVTTDEGAS